jgi:hypothetical protein
MARLANSFGKHKWWILTALLTAPLVAVAAGVPNMFTPGTDNTTAEVNPNYKTHRDRVTALEAAKTTVQIVMNNKPAPATGLPATGMTAMFTSSGGPLLVIVSGTAYRGAGNTMDIAVQLDGTSLGDLVGYTNEVGSHKALPTRVFSVTPSAGSHTIALIAVSATATDSNDYFSITVVETH